MKTIATITANVSTAKALLLSSPKSDFRYYLNGFGLEGHGKGSAVLATTDGHRGFAQVAECEGSEAFKVVVPRAVLETMAKTKKPWTAVKLQVVQNEPADGAIGKFFVSLDGVITPCVDGHFPDFARIIPDLSSAVPAMAHCNAEYIVDARKQELYAKDEGLPKDGAYIGSVHGFVQDKAASDSSLRLYLNDVMPEAIPLGLSVPELIDKLSASQVLVMMQDFACPS